MHLSTFSNTASFRDCLFSIACFCLLYYQLIAYLCVGFLLGSLFSAIDQYVWFFFCHYHIVLITDPGSIPVLGRSGERHGNPLQYSCLGNPMDRVAWRATAHGATESDMTEQLTFV